jgi:hypothetical protein
MKELATRGTRWDGEVRGMKPESENDGRMGKV